MHVIQRTSDHAIDTPPHRARRLAVVSWACTSVVAAWQAIRFALPFAFLSLALTPLCADEIAWEAIADDAAVVVRLKDPQAAMKQWSEFAALAGGGAADEYAQALVSSLGELLSNPKLAGIERELSWWIAFYETDAASEPAVVCVIPAADRNSLQEALGKELRLMELGKYVVYSSNSAIAEKTTARLKGQGRSIKKIIDAESLALFDRGQIAVYINCPPLLRDLRAQNGKLRVNVDATPESGVDLPSQDSPSKADATWAHAGDDTQSVTLAAQISDEGVLIDCLARLRPGSRTARLLPKTAAERIPDLAALPAGQNLYVGVTGNLLNQLRSNKELWQGETEQFRNPRPELLAAQAKLDKLKLDTLIYSTNVVNFGAVVDETIVIRMNRPKSFRELQRQIVAGTNGAETASFQWGVELNVDAERYGTALADISNWRRTFRKHADANWLAKDWTTRSVYLNDRVVETAGGDREAMERVLAALDKENNRRPEKSPFQLTRSKLDAEADLILLVDAPKVCVTFVERFATALGQAIFEGITFGLVRGEMKTRGGGLLEKLDLADSYSGLSAVVQPDGIRVRAFVPLEQIQGFVRVAQAASGPVAAANDHQDDVDVDEPKDVMDEELPAAVQLDADYFEREVFGSDKPEGAARSRKLFEIILELKLSSYEWACRLKDIQKRKILLAGRGDIEHSFAQVDVHRQAFSQLAHSEPDADCWNRQVKESAAAKAIVDSDPFGERSLFQSTLKNSLSAEQFPQYEAVRVILHAGGRVKTRTCGSADLREIDLHVTRFSNAGMGLLERLTNVQVLNLESTRVTDAGLARLSGLSELEDLDLGDLQVTEACLARLQGLKKLRRLNLQGTPAGDATLLALKGLTKLRSLGLFGTLISDQGMAALHGLGDLEVLTLGATRISDAGLLHLSPQAAAHLKELDLQQTQITDSGLKIIGRLKNLELLELRSTRVTDAGLGELSNLTRLKELYLSGADVTDAAVADLQRTLPDVKIYK
ncbi:MAG TPA: hypothetical protein VGH74_06460 [Planctomycetaceae bacterium]|jgi:hypothetical protein